MISIGLPIYNEDKTIIQTLNSVAEARQQLNQRSEVLVCFSGTTDTSKNIVSAYDKLELQIIESDKGKTCAVNQIVKESKGDLIIFCDGDISVLPDCFEKLVRNFGDESVLVVTGCPIPYTSNSLIYNVINARMLHPFSEIACFPANRSNDKPFIHGRIFGVRRSVFDESFPIDSFVENMGDDTFLSHFVIKHYGRQALKREHEAKVRYHAVTSVANWWKKWKRIWGDIEEMYRNNPEFEELRDVMKTKLDWSYVRTLPIRNQAYFVLERILHKSGRKLFELIEFDKKPEWERLEDTKKI